MNQIIRHILMCCAAIFIALLLWDFGLAFVNGMKANEREAAYQQRERRQRIEKPCIDAGGIPIWSSWTNDLKTCVFPPKS